MASIVKLGKGKQPPRAIDFTDPDSGKRQRIRLGVVSFDEAGLVVTTQTYALEDGRPIDPVDRITPTEGRDLSVLQQLLGNIGKYPSQ